MKSVRVCGQVFSEEMYQLFLTSFKENFSYSSLSVESAFEEVDDCNARIHSLRNQKAYEYYQMLDSNEKKEIDKFLKRYTVFRGYQVGILTGKYQDSLSDSDISKIFKKNFQYMYDDMHTIICFDKDGKFLQKETFFKMGEMFRLTFQKRQIEDEAYRMQKDHMDAFDFAMKLDSIKARDMIKINSIVNKSDVNREIGFKKTDNAIIGSKFDVSSKESTPIRVQELLKEYDEDFGLELLDYQDPTISYHEKNKRLYQVFLKEAIFHIRFIRIHPFADGNGRTARIIMNKHLIDNHLAPVLINHYMSSEYRKCIENCDYDGLARMMLASSTQLLSSWVSMEKVGITQHKLNTSNEGLAVPLNYKKNVKK